MRNGVTRNLKRHVALQFSCRPENTARLACGLRVRAEQRRVGSAQDRTRPECPVSGRNDAAGSPGGTKLITRAWTIQKPEHCPATSCRFFLANNRRCTALSRAKAVWYHLPENTLWWKFLLGLPIIPSGSHDHKLQCRNDKQPLAAFALRHPHALQAPDHPALWLAEGDFEHEPLIAIAATSSAPITGVDAARYPFGWNDGAAVDFAPVQHHDADTRQIAHRPACARSRQRHAAAPGRPLRRTLTKRIEKELAREFVQCLARSLGDDARKQSCRTAAIAPVAPGVS
jgi:hypothetical protein